MELIQEKDINRLLDETKFVDCFKNKSIFITGASGLIGGFLYKYFIKMNARFNTNAKIFCLIRDLNRIEKEFQNSEVIWVIGDIRYKLSLNEHVDFIFHCASPTDSKFFAKNPVETIDTAYQGTNNILNFAKENGCESLVYLSSLESYGINLDKDRIIDESFLGEISLSDVRSSYPESKRMCENLCYCFHAQYQVPVKIARLTQVISFFEETDNRFVASLVKSVRNNEPIVMQTTGESSRPYIYISDAINALLHILIKGISGETYNVATPTTYISAFNFASNVMHKYLNKDVDLKLNPGNFFLKPTYMNLNMDKLTSLGWIANYDLEQSFERVLHYYLHKKC